MSIKAILRNAGELLIGEVVNECEELIEFSDLSFVVIGQGQTQNQVGLQFIPVELVSVNPPVPLKAITENEEGVKSTVTVYRNQLLNDNVKLKAEIIENFESARNPSRIIMPKNDIITPESSDNKVIKLFD